MHCSSKPTLPMAIVYGDKLFYFSFLNTLKRVEQSYVALIGKKPHDVGKNRIRKVAVISSPNIREQGDKFKDDEMGETRRKHGRDKK
jgi:hypothetical protein